MWMLDVGRGCDEANEICSVILILGIKENPIISLDLFLNDERGLVVSQGMEDGWMDGK